nr:hypothetical protein Iba_chr03bCG1420 [Ipomoea batatas]
MGVHLDLECPHRGPVKYCRITHVLGGYLLSSPPLPVPAAVAAPPDASERHRYSECSSDRAAPSPMASWWLSSFLGPAVYEDPSPRIAVLHSRNKSVRYTLWRFLCLPPNVKLRTSLRAFNAGFRILTVLGFVSMNLPALPPNPRYLPNCITENSYCCPNTVNLMEGVHWWLDAIGSKVAINSCTTGSVEKWEVEIEPPETALDCTSVDPHLGALVLGLREPRGWTRASIWASDFMLSDSAWSSVGRELDALPTLRPSEHILIFCSLGNGRACGRASIKASRPYVGATGTTIAARTTGANGTTTGAGTTGANGTTTGAGTAAAGTSPCTAAGTSPCGAAC